MTIQRFAKEAFYSVTALVDKIQRGRPDLSPQHLRSFSNFLLIQNPSALGSAVHATPVVKALRKARPDARIVVAASGLAEQVFANNPFADSVIKVPSPLKNLNEAVDKFKIIDPFQGEPFVAITLLGNERSPNALFSIRIGAALRVGSTVAPRLYDLPFKFDPERSQIDNNLRVIQMLGWPSVTSMEPLIRPSEDAKSKARYLLEQHAFLDGKPIVALITQTSVTQRKSWRHERFAEVARYLHQHYQAHLLFIGTQAEREKVEELRQWIGLPSANIAGETSIPELAAAFQQCTIGVTLDTGPLHVGRAVGLPMVIIAPAWSPEVEWLPVGNPRYRILKKATIPVPPPADYIIDEVSAQDVMHAIDELFLAFRQ